MASAKAEFAIPATHRWTTAPARPGSGCHRRARRQGRGQRPARLPADRRPHFVHEADHRISRAHAALVVATRAAVDPASAKRSTTPTRALSAGCGRCAANLRPSRPETRSSAVTASLGPDRALRKAYEQSLAAAQALGERSAPATSSTATGSSWWTWVLVACLVVGVGVTFRNDLT
jgi:hypothetical protein